MSSNWAENERKCLNWNNKNTVTYLPTFKFQKEEQMRGKNLKRGTFLNFLYITIQRLLQKQEHMIKSFSFLLRKEELFLQKRNSWQVCCNQPKTEHKNTKISSQSGTFSCLHWGVFLLLTHAALSTQKNETEEMHCGKTWIPFLPSSNLMMIAC